MFCFPPDIHKVAEEIAAVTNIDLHKVRLTLVSQWLPSSASKQSDGESVSEPYWSN